MKTLLLCMAFCTFTLFAREPIEKGLEKYQAAEKSQVPEERSKLFNEALSIYLPYTKENPSGELLGNVGNCYFYLGDIGLAIGYYRNGLVQSPRNQMIKNNLSLAIDKGHLFGSQITTPIADGFALRWLSPYERTLLAIGLIAVSFVLFSLDVWLPGFGFRPVWTVFAAATCLLLLMLGAYGLFMPVEAVIVKETQLRTAVAQEPTTSAVVLHPGEMVEILSYDPTQEWLRVRTVTGLPGYLPSTSLFCLSK